MFRNPFVIEFRKVGVEAKEYVTSLALTEIEKQVIDLIGIGKAEFVTERHLLKAGLVRSLFNYYERTVSKEEVSHAGYSYYRNLDEYFSSRPGMDSVTGGTLMMRAFEKYQVGEPLDLAECFLASLVDQVDPERARKIPGLVDLMGFYIKDAIAFLTPRIAKLK